MSWFWFVIRPTGVGFRRSLPEIQISSLGAQDRSFLVASLIVNAWILTTGKYFYSDAAPPAALVETADWVAAFVVVTILFAFIFKVLPRVPLRWGDVTLGAVFTSLLFAAGKFLLGVYLGKVGFADTCGAAGSLVVVLVWVYYSAQVLF